MIASLVTATATLAWFVALSPPSTVNDPTVYTVWSITLTVWLASRRLLAAYRRRPTR